MWIRVNNKDGSVFVESNSVAALKITDGGRVLVKLEGSSDWLNVHHESEGKDEFDKVLKALGFDQKSVV